MSLCVWFDGSANFKRILVLKVQDTFELGLKELTDAAANGEGLEPKAQQARHVRMLGNIRFLGSLLTHSMVSSKIIVPVIEELLQSASAASIELLCAFLTTIGPKFDNPLWRGHEKFSSVFTGLGNMQTALCSSPHLQEIVNQVLCLRKEGWPEGKCANKNCQI